MFNALRAFWHAAKPLMFNALRAFWHAATQGPRTALVWALAFLLTILPVLVFLKAAAVYPDLVLLILPAKTWRLASLAEIGFFFIAFMAAIAFIAFIAFIALAMLRKWSGRSRQNQ